MAAPDKPLVVDKSVPAISYFGIFQVDRRSTELFRRGVKVKVQEQPMQVLLMLLEHPGQVVTREEIRQRLWPVDTFVEFDHSVNTAIKKLRQTLGDDADNPRFIETLPRKGYRFIAPVSSSSQETTTEDSSSSETAQQLPGAPWASRGWQQVVIVSTAVIVIVAIALFAAFNHEKMLPTGAPAIVPFTSSPGFEGQPSISPDGQRVVYTWAHGYNPKHSFPHLFIKAFGSEEIFELTKGDDVEFSPAWSPEGSTIAFERCPGTIGTATRCGIYLVSPMGGVERLIKTVDGGQEYGTAATGPFLNWSPDGKTLAYVDRGSLGTASIMLLDMQTLQSRQLTNPEPPLVGDTSPAFSPDGKMIAFARNGKEVSNPWVISVDGGQPRRLSEIDQMMTPGIAWDADGSSIIFGGFGLYRVPLRGGKVETITTSSMIVGPATRGHRLVFSQYSWSKKIWGVNLDRNGNAIAKPELVLDSTRDQEGPSFSPDGKRVVFDSLRSGYYEIWRSDVDGGNLLRLTNFRGPLTGTPSFSPDGQTVIFDSRIQGNAHLFAVSPEGGPVRQLTSGTFDDIMPSYSHDGRWIYFPSNRGGGWNVWKMPAQGGTAVQLTRAGGYNGVESSDGQFFYYAKGLEGPGLWRVPAQGGKEEAVMPDKPIAMLNGYIAIHDGKLFYADSESIDFKAQSIHIRVRDLATGKDREILELDHPPAFGPPGLAVSPDGSKLFFVTEENSGADLQTVENFR